MTDELRTALERWAAAYKACEDRGPDAPILKLLDLEIVAARNLYAAWLDTQNSDSEERYRSKIFAAGLTLHTLRGSATPYSVLNAANEETAHYASYSALYSDLVLFYGWIKEPS